MQPVKTNINPCNFYDNEYLYEYKSYKVSVFNERDGGCTVHLPTTEKEQKEGASNSISREFSKGFESGEVQAIVKRYIDLLLDIERSAWIEPNWNGDDNFACKNTAHRIKSGVEDIELFRLWYLIGKNNRSHLPSLGKHLTRMHELINSTHSDANNLKHWWEMNRERVQGVKPYLKRLP